MTERVAIAAVILAAGRSTRMGRPKQLLEVAGKPLLQHVIDAAAASCLDEILVVLGHRAKEVSAALDLPERGHIVVCDNYERGQSASLRAGLAATSPSSRAAAILLGDQPSIDSTLIDTVAHAFVASGSLCVRPVYSAADGARLPGHPVVLGRAMWPNIERLTGDRGARSVLAEHPEWIVEVNVAGDPPLDVDSPEDYEALALTPKGRDSWRSKFEKPSR